jgi:hypothetical protein
MNCPIDQCTNPRRDYAIVCGYHWKRLPARVQDAANGRNSRRAGTVTIAGIVDWLNRQEALLHEPIT